MFNISNEIILPELDEATVSALHFGSELSQALVIIMPFCFVIAGVAAVVVLGGKGIKSKISGSLLLLVSLASMGLGIASFGMERTLNEMDSTVDVLIYGEEKRETRALNSKIMLASLSDVPQYIEGKVKGYGTVTFYVDGRVLSSDFTPSGLLSRPAGESLSKETAEEEEHGVSESIGDIEAFVDGLNNDDKRALFMSLFDEFSTE